MKFSWISLGLAVPLITLFSASASPADTVVTFSTNIGQVRDRDGNTLPVETVIRVGYFNTSGGNLVILQNSDSFAEVDSLFTPLAEGRANAGQVSQLNNPGGLTLEINDFPVTGGAFGSIENISPLYLPEGTQLAAWVMLGPTMQSATQWAIFTSSTGWNAPPDMGANTLATEEVDTVYRGALTADGNILLSAVVPEPSSASVALLGGTALLLRRRRR